MKNLLVKGEGPPRLLLYPINRRRRGCLPGERRWAAMGKRSLRAQCQQRSRVLAQALSFLNSPTHRRH